MDSISLCRFACGDKFIRKGFGGVFSCDTLPKLRNKFNSFIINLDRHTLPGSHWVAVHFKNEKASYFDSYGRPPSKIILKFLKANSKKIEINKFCFQDFATLTCGYFCLYFLFNMCRNLTLNKLNKNNQTKNEALIARFAKTQLKLGNCCHSFHDKIQSCSALLNML